MTMIENSERGITITKGLAWTIVCGLVGAGIWLGIQTTTATSGIENLQDGADRMEKKLENLEARVRNLEMGSSERKAAFSHVTSELNEVQSEVRENNRLLRQLLQRSQDPR